MIEFLLGSRRAQHTSVTQESWSCRTSSRRIYPCRERSVSRRSPVRRSEIKRETVEVDHERLPRTFKPDKDLSDAKGPAVIVRDFNLAIKKGEFVCLIGHSGCGKSTVLSMVAGLNEITERRDHSGRQGTGRAGTGSRSGFSIALLAAVDDRF